MINDTHDSWLELADIYAVGALEGRDLENFKVHLSNHCKICDKYLVDLSALTSRIAGTLPLSSPPASVKTKLMASVSKEALGAKWAGKAGMGIGLLAGIVATGLVAFIHFNLLPVPENSAKIIHDEWMAKILSSPDLERIDMKSPDTKVSKATAVLFWNSDSCGGCLIIQGLLKIAKNKTYQVWGIEEGRPPVSLGTLKPDATGTAHKDFRTLNNKRDFKKFAVTLEPAGGTPQPTGPTYLLGIL